MPDGRWSLIGLISWGYGCGKGTVFTRVTSFLPWIKEKLENN
jgi:secreted trypsin-like serine protease